MLKETRALGWSGVDHSICVALGLKATFMGKVEIYGILELALEPSSHCLMNNKSKTQINAVLSKYSGRLHAQAVGYGEWMLTNACSRRKSSLSLGTCFKAFLRWLLLFFFLLVLLANLFFAGYTFAFHFYKTPREKKARNNLCFLKTLRQSIWGKPKEQRLGHKFILFTLRLFHGREAVSLLFLGSWPPI